ncbi:hypothetical protein KA005_74200 [bacterium]|nr:hypothetical protein [bacterium]
MARKQRTTKVGNVELTEAETVSMLKRHTREERTERIAKGEPEPRLSPFMTVEDPKKWIEETSKETGVRTDVSKESKDLTRRAIEARQEAEKMMGIKRGVTKKKKKKK